MEDEMEDDVESKIVDCLKVAVCLIENGADGTEIIGSRRRRRGGQIDRSSSADSNTGASVVMSREFLLGFFEYLSTQRERATDLELIDVITTFEHMIRATVLSGTYHDDTPDYSASSSVI